jgi:PAS domain-containing protein
MSQGDNAGLQANQIIQAGHSLLTLVESSKGHLENLIDGLNDGFGVISEDNQIMKSNRSLAKLGGFPPEANFEADFLDYFVKEDRNLVEQKIADCRKANEDPSFQVETTFEGSLKAFPNSVVQWVFKPFPGRRIETRGWVQLIGRDVTEARSQERKLAQIFSNLPIGILQLDGSVSIKPPVSSRCKYLFGSENLEGKSFFDVLFKPVWEELTIAEKEAVGIAMSIVGYNEIQFELVKDDLPKRIVFTKPDSTQLVLGLTFSPLVRAGLVDCLLVVIEDRTETEKASKDEELRVQREGAALRRYKETVSVPSKLAAVIVSDMEKSYNACCAIKDTSDHLGLVKILHSIKGLARIAKLNTLKTMTHELEEALLHPDEHSALGELDRAKLRIEEECHECFLLLKFRLEHSKNTENQKFSWSDQMQEKTKANIEDICKKLGKQVRLEFQLAESVPEHTSRVFEEALLHAITNSLDHGIELPEERKGKGKTPEGCITVSHSSDALFDTLLIEDDGRGFDFGKLRGKLVEKGFAGSEVETWGEEKILQLLFLDGFSTAETTTELSGRGVGIGAVAALAKEMKGEAKFESRKPCGSIFKVTVPKERK